MSILSKYLDANSKMSADLQSQINPSDSVELLKAGYERYISNEALEEAPFDDKSSESTLHQYPYAAILSCIDARLSITDIFDDNHGGLIVSRIAGNIATTEITGSL
jgi:carbonic anhydrase